MNKKKRVFIGILFSILIFLFILFIYYGILEPSIITQGFYLIPGYVILVGSTIPSVLLGIAAYKII